MDQWDSHYLEDSEALFKGIKYLEDTEILGRLSKENPKIAKQISEYTLLAPKFNFGILSPILWRKTVYEFALAYFEKGNGRLE